MAARGGPAPARGRQPSTPQAGGRRRLAARPRAARRDGLAQRLADRRGEHRIRSTRCAMSTLLLNSKVDGVLVGSSDPPAADERRALGELAALIAAAAGRRPELVVVLAGGMSDHLPAFGDVGRRPGEVVLGPSARRGIAGRPAGGSPARARAAARRRPSLARLGRHGARRRARSPRRRRRDRL